MVYELYLNKTTKMVLKEKRSLIYRTQDAGGGQQTNRTNKNFTKEKMLPGKQDRVMGEAVGVGDTWLKPE